MHATKENACKSRCMVLIKVCHRETYYKKRIEKAICVHAKTYHKSAKKFFAFAYDFALLRPSARPCKI